MRPVRHLVFVVVALLACLALPLAIVSTWTANVVTDTDGYVRGGRAAGRRPGGAGIGRGAAPGRDARPAAAGAAPDRRRAVVRVVEGPEFRPAWEEANRSAHEQMVAVARGRPRTARSPTTARSPSRSAPLLVAVIEAVDTHGPGRHLERPRHPRPSSAWSRPTSSRQARTTYRLVHVAGLWLPVVWLLLVAVALLVAVRRRRALAWLGARVRWSASAALLLAIVAGPPGGDRPRGHRRERPGRRDLGRGHRRAAQRRLAGRIAARPGGAAAGAGARPAGRPVPRLPWPEASRPTPGCG